MKVFSFKCGPFSAKVNFVDENNVFVGFDLSQQCCEFATWFISDKEEGPLFASSQAGDLNQPEELPLYAFDPDYITRKTAGVGDERGAEVVRFRLISVYGDEKPQYLHLVNTHNGYYAHNFSMGSLMVTMDDSI